MEKKKYLLNLAGAGKASKHLSVLILTAAQPAWCYSAKILSFQCVQTSFLVN